MSARNLDASRLPDYGFGARTVLGIGTWGFIAIEGCVFAVLALTWLYGIGRAEAFPPPPWPPPPLLYATVNTALLLAAVGPNLLCKRAAERLDLRPARAWLAAGLALTAVVLVVRAFEFRALPVRWDDNFYGSILWTTLGFHTLHLLSNALEAGVLLVLSFRRGVRPHRLSDIADSAFYGCLSAAVWIPLYFLFYVYPRFD